MVGGKPKVKTIRTMIFEEDSMLQKNFNPAIEEEKVEDKVTSSSFKQKIQNNKWTTRETRKFYKLLEIFGTDFQMIESLFLTRTREEIKKKFQKEEKEQNLKMQRLILLNDGSHKKEVNRIEHALMRHAKIKPKKLNKRVNQLNRMLLKEPIYKV